MEIICSERVVVNGKCFLTFTVSVNISHTFKPHAEIVL